ncbi:porphobilinogen deaminase [Annulohypoxylon maeteangense]|uniref:porphobilinogen deaminase n=1 Tax=Annulohypoxylon maeteangense TaxID=1927788 RepID=UPI002007A8E0|nr:porphobilinogen deaminase [Annulohypoxylon maeteangense]KAI0883278.1 porphobilinogen deaminase [Annulohypoxylon maeteangense]
MSTTAASDTPKTVIRVGTRKSALALLQADYVVSSLRKLHPTVDFEIKGMHSTADKDKITALYKFGGKGLWTNELEAELKLGQVDFIVHSLKDMPTVLPDEFVLACVTPREDARDVVVVKKGLEDKYKTLADLPAGAVVGTSSVRRMAQIRRRYPHLAFKDMRGNIDTRVKKLDAEDSEFTVLILAAAGLLRSGKEDRITQYLDSTTVGGGMLHAVGQGGLGIEARVGDQKTLDLLKALEDNEAMFACEAERSVMRTLEGGCSIPIGVETKWVGDNKLKLTATVVNVEGTEAADAEKTEEVKTREEAVAFGIKVAQQLADNGAQKILDVINGERAATQDKKEPWVPA